MQPEKKRFLGHAQTERNTIKTVILRAEGAILESVFLLIAFSQAQGGATLVRPQISPPPSDKA